MLTIGTDLIVKISYTNEYPEGLKGRTPGELRTRAEARLEAKIRDALSCPGISMTVMQTYTTMSQR